MRRTLEVRRESAQRRGGFDRAMIADSHGVGP